MNPSQSYGTNLPYGITQCYLPPDTSERTPASPQPSRLVLDLPISKGWKAELALVAWLNTKTVEPWTVTHPSSNPARRRVTWIIDVTNDVTTRAKPPPNLMHKEWKSFCRQNYLIKTFKLLTTKWIPMRQSQNSYLPTSLSSHAQQLTSRNFWSRWPTPPVIQPIIIK